MFRASSMFSAIAVGLLTLACRGDGSTDPDEDQQAECVVAVAERTEEIQAAYRAGTLTDEATLIFLESFGEEYAPIPAQEEVARTVPGCEWMAAEEPDDAP